MTSASLFKWTVALLAIPAVLLTAVVIRIAFLMFVRSQTGGIGGGAFFVVIDPFRITVIAGATFGIIIALYAAGRRLVRGN